MAADVRDRLRTMRLYALLTEQHCRRPWLEAAQMLLEGGVDVLQLREKEIEDGEFLKRARRLRELTARHGALFIVNDRADAALLCDADGVHLGQTDLPPEDVRRVVGRGMIIGLSTHTPEQAAEAESRGADYAGVGPVYPTETKGYEQGGGPEFVTRLCSATRLPTVAIGGITPQRAGKVIAAGAQAVAACAALCGAEDPKRAARAFRDAIEKSTART